MSKTNTLRALAYPQLIGTYKTYLGIMQDEQTCQQELTLTILDNL